MLWAASYWTGRPQARHIKVSQRGQMALALSTIDFSMLQAVAAQMRDYQRHDFFHRRAYFSQRHDDDAADAMPLNACMTTAQVREHGAFSASMRSLLGNDYSPAPAHCTSTAVGLLSFCRVLTPPVIYDIAMI